MEEKNQPRRPRRSPEEPLQKNESLVYGKNPVTELLKSGSGVDTVLIAEGMAPAVAAYYTALAKEAGATVKRVHPNKLRLMTGTESHQGVAAFASEIEYVTVDDLMAAAKDKGEAPFLVLSDGIEDPHNLGAVMRSALLCGAHGIVIPKRGGASVTPTVIKSSAGAAERQHLISRGQTGIVCAAHTAVDGTRKALTVGVLHESEENDDERSDQQDHTANNFDNRHGLKRSFILIQQKLRRNTNI